MYAGMSMCVGHACEHGASQYALWSERYILR